MIGGALDAPVIIINHHRPSGRTCRRSGERILCQEEREQKKKMMMMMMMSENKIKMTRTNEWENGAFVVGGTLAIRQAVHTIGRSIISAYDGSTR